MAFPVHFSYLLFPLIIVVGRNWHWWRVTMLKSLFKTLLSPSFCGEWFLPPIQYSDKARFVSPLNVQVVSQEIPAYFCSFVFLTVLYKWSTKPVTVKWILPAEDFSLEGCQSRIFHELWILRHTKFSADKKPMTTIFSNCIAIAVSTFPVLY